MIKKRYIYSVIMGIVVIVVFPYILRIEGVRNIIGDWLSFSDNLDYKVAYIQLIGGILGTFIAVYGALFVQREQQRVDEYKKKLESGRKIYNELNSCLEQLQNIFRETKIIYHLKEIEKDDIIKFCAIAKGKKMFLKEDWVDNLVVAGDIFGVDDIIMIHKYYYKLYVIQQALESNDEDEIQKVFVPYIRWFITADGNGWNNNVEGPMKRFKERVKG